MMAIFVRETKRQAARTLSLRPVLRCTYGHGSNISSRCVKSSHDSFQSTVPPGTAYSHCHVESSLDVPKVLHPPRNPKNLVQSTCGTGRIQPPATSVTSRSQSGGHRGTGATVVGMSEAVHGAPST
ncbi:hypothetical protein OH76DRAFT_868352 [Lentinus brumalis]|uniref:Uncharacterized protein n=1 Tax=Lentinus brumalis TaxID=2498619 RepID=A0A371DRF1_9APHY|nr:hypothetical protein OH76DRAFT_868352 [Polyporus brumalis]